jgi:hypothetical protein
MISWRERGADRAAAPAGGNGGAGRVRMLPHWWILPPDTGSASWRSPVAERLRGHVSPDSDPFAPFEFQLAATELFRAEVEPFLDEVPRN